MFAKITIPKLLRLLNPWQTFRALEDYGNTIQAIEISKDCDKINQIRLTIGCILMAATLFIKLYLFEPRSEWRQLIQYDFFQLNGFPKNVKLFWIALILSNAYMYQVMYLKSYRLKCTQIIKSLMVDGDRRYIFNSNIPIRKWAEMAMSLFGSSLFVNEFWCVFGYCQSVIRISRMAELWHWSGLFGFLSMTLCWLFSSFNFVSYLFIHCLCCSTAVVASAIYFERLIQIGLLIERPLDLITPNRVIRFQRLYVESLRYLFSFNQIFGRLLLAFLLSNCPLNATILSSIMLGRLDPMQSLFLGNVGLNQLVGFLFVHLLATSFSKRTHKPAKRLIKLHVELDKFGHSSTSYLEFHLRLSHFIETIHTKKRLGITYGPIGLISMATFVKFAMLYAKYLMSVYRRLYTE